MPVKFPNLSSDSPKKLAYFHFDRSLRKKKTEVWLVFERYANSTLNYFHMIAKRRNPIRIIFISIENKQLAASTEIVRQNMMFKVMLKTCIHMIHKFLNLLIASGYEPVIHTSKNKWFNIFLEFSDQLIYRNVFIYVYIAKNTRLNTDINLPLDNCFP